MSKENIDVKNLSKNQKLKRTQAEIQKDLPRSALIIIIVYTLTRSIKTSIFCSANRLAMQDLIPWLKGRTKYGLMGLLDFDSDDFSQRSGMNLPGSSKYLAKRHEIKF